MKNIKLSISEQIQDMKVKGVKFTIIKEEEAESYLRCSTFYFRLKAYAKNFDKANAGPNKGEYLNLEFAYLVELSILDMLFRNIVFMMTQDIEHYAKNMLVHDVTRSFDEDGLSIVKETFSTDALKEILNSKRRTGACRDLIEANGDEWPVWRLVEVLSFSDLIKLYETFYYKHPEYNNYASQLYAAKYLRNAAAHNNCLLNSIKRTYTADTQICDMTIWNRLCKAGFTVEKQKAEKMRQNGEFPVTSQALRKYMDNHLINDFISVVLLYNDIVTSKGLKKHRLAELQKLFDINMCKNGPYFAKCYCIVNSYRIAKKLVDFIAEGRI